MLIERNRKRVRRLQLILVAAAALGSSSASISGMFAAFAIQQPAGEVVA